jgi:uncharacterized protein (DUF58 family)
MSHLLQPKILMQIKNLQLAAKATIDGFMAGFHKSNVKGPGLEFSQYRSYEAGDDLRWIDWKMFARSDRYYIRESEIETSISVRFLVDASNSMNHADSGFTKIDYAKYTTACLAYLAKQQADAIGLYVFKSGEIFSLPVKNDSQHLHRFYHELENIEPNGKFTNPVHYKNIFTEIRKRELLVFITDFYEENNEITKLLTDLSHNKHEIIVFQIMGNNELAFDYKGYTQLEDLETGKTIAINTNQPDKSYQQKVENYLAQTKTQLLDKNIFYYLLKMNEPLDEALRNFLNFRNKSTR